MADKFVMVGDYYQENPNIKSKISEKRGMGQSLFEKLCKAHPEYATVLNLQYKMHPKIMEVSNVLVYNGKMESGKD